MRGMDESLYRAYAAREASLPVSARRGYSKSELPLRAGGNINVHGQGLKPAQQESAASEFHGLKPVANGRVAG